MYNKRLAKNAVSVKLMIDCYKSYLQRIYLSQLIHSLSTDI